MSGPRKAVVCEAAVRRGGRSSRKDLANRGTHSCVPQNFARWLHERKNTMWTSPRALPAFFFTLPVPFYLFVSEKAPEKGKSRRLLHVYARGIKGVYRLLNRQISIEILVPNAVCLLRSNATLGVLELSLKLFQTPKTNARLQILQPNHLTPER